MRYKQKHFYIWNNDIAYLTGLIASDGCLVNDGRHIALTSRDLDIIVAAQTILGKVHLKIGIKTGQFGTDAYQFQWADVVLYDFLASAGITPAKSKTIQSVNVPDKYYFDFLRGYFDGDGTVYGYKDPRWNRCFMYYTAFASASPNFLVWLSLQNERLAGTSTGKVLTKTRVHTLTYAKSDSRLLFKAMYQSQPSYKLTRKYEKFAGFINTDLYAKITAKGEWWNPVDTHA